MAIKLRAAHSQTRPEHRPPAYLDLLRAPIVGKILAWRWGRLTFQIFLLAVASLIIYDGLTGPQLAPANSATVLAWIHYRGLVLLLLLLAGNFFCFACPFTLPRTVARRLSLAGPRWPRSLRNKWVSIAGLLLIFWLYEWLDLWASPWLTAWVAVAYFAGALLLEAIFTDSPFCKYVCPLGAFNFVYSTLSPLRISARSLDTCASCEGKECVNGSSTVLGCGTNLYVPMIRSNMDCIFCLDCARACPYDNVGLTLRSPLGEASSRRWHPRADIAFLLLTMTTFALSNAFGMVAPVYEVLRWMTTSLGLPSEGLRLLILFVTLNIAAPAIMLTLGACLSARLTDDRHLRLADLASRYAPAFIPLSAGIWMAHYGFHFAIGALTIVPVMQAFVLDHGLHWLGEAPRWELGALLPQEAIFPLQVSAVLGGFIFALYSLARRSLSHESEPKRAFLQMLPWAFIVAALAAIALQIFDLPMEMRGSMQFVPD